MNLFEADSERRPYKAGLDTFIVSPVNARKQLAAFIHKAKKELLIYDPNIADTEMAKALINRAKAGVKIRIIGAMSRKNPAHRRPPADRAPVAHTRHHSRPPRGVRGQSEPAQDRTRRAPRGRRHRPRSRRR